MTVDPTTVTFAGAPAIKSKLMDVNFDGYTDLLLNFSIQALNLDKFSAEATLAGMTYDDIDIEGTDSVTIVTKGKK